MNQTIKIMLVDDHALLRSGLKLLLQKKPFCEVIGEAADGIEALQLYQALKPDILILDITLPKLDGIQVLNEIKLRDPGAKVIVLTMHEDEDYIKSIMHAGALGYIPKAAVDEELYTAIDTVAAGEIYLRPKETQALIATMFKKKETKSLESDNPYIILSPREREVIRLLARGYSLTEIAKELNLSIKTVDTHKARIMNKLSVSRKSELVDYAIKHKLLSDELL